MMEITWASYTHLLPGLLILVSAGALLCYRIMRARSAARVLSAAKHATYLLPNFSFAKHILKSILFFVGLIFLVLALMRPQWGKREQTIAQEGRDLFIALDISRSMLAQDCAPNRLACAKAKIKALVSLLSCERVGLILFSGSTFVQCPLTNDYNAFYMYLDAIDAETISSGTTALDQAVQKALAVFSQHAGKKTKLLALFTDGEDFSSDLAAVKQQAAQAGITIFALGIGTAQGAPVPLFDHAGKPIGHQQDKKGSVVISRLNQEILQGLVTECGGTFITMTPDDTDIKNLVARVQHFEKEKFEERKVSLFQEQYHYFVAVSFICYLIEWLL
jgi:Ca-activated chloride channel family protein